MSLRRFFHRTTWKTNKGVLTVGLLLGMLAGTLVLVGPESLRRLDRLVYDFMLNGLDRKPAHAKVLIVDVDEASLGRYGQWPWPRHLVARLLDTIRDGEPDAVGVDILFAEPDRTSLKFVSQDLQTHFGRTIDVTDLPEEMLDHDWALSRVVQRGRFSFGLMFSFDERDRIAHALPGSGVSMTVINQQGEGRSSFPAAESFVATLPELAQAADVMGFLNAVPDTDGVLRRVPLLIRYKDVFYPSFALSTYLLTQEKKSVLVDSSYRWFHALKVAGTTVPVDQHGFTAVRFRGPAKTYPYISAADVLDGTVTPQTFHGAVVFIGSSAEGLKDAHATPLDRHMPGVEVNATMVGALLDGDFISLPVWTTVLQAAGALLAVVLATVMIVQFSTWATGLTLFAIVCAVTGGSVTLLTKYQIFLSPVPVTVAFVLSFALLALTRFRSEELRLARRERQLAAAKDCAMVGWASLAETRDTETGNHIFRTQKYVRAMAELLLDHKDPDYRLQPEEVDLLFKSSPLHDVGKVGIPDSILLKPGRLTPTEFEEMKKHTVYGAKALARAEQASGLTDETSFLKTAREIALTHHEKWDGTGYPCGLQGKDIPLSGRLMALADVYDALTSKRVYKTAMGHEEAVRIICESSNSHFDPEIVALFVAIEHVFKVISEEHADH
ncbi:MAG: CHASE2 domain-containing protein [Desulfobulbus sp.]|nr:CHASE2 domain-containing protein [Desulfobulbus sp.]